MKSIIKGINSTLPGIHKLSENKKISYWLERLHSQEKDKKNKFLKEGVAAPIIASSQFSPVETEQVLEKKGLADAVKSRASKAEIDRQAVEDMVNNSNRILMRISTVFPWDFFPTSIIVEETRITIVNRQLFSYQAHSVDIKNISNVFIDASILFAQLTIVSNTFAENEIVVDRLWKKEAIFIRRIIEGLRMFVSREIDTTVYEVEELTSKLRKLSTIEMTI